MNKKQCGTVSMPVFAAIIGGIGFIFFSILLLAALFTSAGTGLIIICVFFCLLSGVLILTLNQKIDYTSEGFVYRDMFRISHHYSYSQITKIRYSKDVKIYVGHRIILIDSMASNGKKFARIASQYAPEAKFITDSQSKLFNGNISNPGEFVFVYILFEMLPILFLCWSQYSFRDITLEDLQKNSAVISDFDFKTDDEGDEFICIETINPQNKYKTYYLDENSDDFKNFERDFKLQKSFEIYYEKSKSVKDGFIIRHLNCGENIYVSIDEVNEINCEVREGIMVLCVICCVFWTMYIIVSSYLMCHAEKYPRIIKLFVKPDYIKHNPHNRGVKK